VAYCVTLAGILLRLVPIEERVAASGIAASPSAPISSLQLTISAAAVVLLLAVIAVQSRRVRSAWEAAHPLRAARSLSVRPLRPAQFLRLWPRRAAPSLSFRPLQPRPAPAAPSPNGGPRPLAIRRGHESVHRYRESLIVLASVAIGFALYFGFRTPDQTQSHRQQTYRPVAAMAEKASGTAASPVRSRQVSHWDSDHRVRRNDIRRIRRTRTGAHGIRRSRTREQRAPRVSVEDVAGAITISNAPEAIANPPTATQSVPAATPRREARPRQVSFDDSG
jgi:hypothetical protein